MVMPATPAATPPRPQAQPPTQRRARGDSLQCSSDEGEALPQLPPGLPPPPPGLPPPPPGLPPDPLFATLRDTVTCRFWLSGRCARGEACRFRHALGEGEQLAPARLNATVAEFVPRAYDWDAVDDAGSSATPQASTNATPRASTSTTPQASTNAPSRASTSATPQASTSRLTLDDDADATPSPPPSCDICYETPATYGLLEKCSHVFCLQCIRQWRAPALDSRPDLHESGATKKCPACRTHSNYIIPSSMFHAEGERKTQIVTRYKSILAHKPCKHFEATKNSSRGPRCPFGDECHFKHELVEGSGERYIFGGGFADMQTRSYLQREGLDMIPDEPSWITAPATRRRTTSTQAITESESVAYFLLSYARREQRRLVQHDAVQENLDAYLHGDITEEAAQAWVAAYREAQEQGLPVPPTQVELDREAAAGERWDALEEASGDGAQEESGAATAVREENGTTTAHLSSSRSERRRAQRAYRRSGQGSRSRRSSSSSEDSLVFILDPETEGRGGGGGGASGSGGARSSFAQL